MEIINEENNEKNGNNEWYNEWERSHRRGRIFWGIILLIGGILFSMREMGAELPHWLFTWKIIFILIGLNVGFKHSFRNFSWLFFIIIGLALYAEDILPGIHIKHFVFPFIMLIVGLALIFKPKNRWKNRWERQNQHWHQYRKYYDHTSTSSEDKVNCTTVFGGIKKNIISKNFRGGEVINVFGGTELNMSQADIEGTVKIEIENVFGGTKLIVPPNWKIQSELVAVMGGVKDERNILHDQNSDNTKILLLEGNVIFGGIQITNF